MSDVIKSHLYKEGKLIEEITYAVVRPITMHIYRDGTKLEEREFAKRFTFYIKGEIHFAWFSDEEKPEKVIGPISVEGEAKLSWTSDEEKPTEEFGLMWLYITPYSYPAANFVINGVPAEWQLIIDDIPQDQGKVYSELDVAGKKVELQYRNYQFVCSFPPLGVNTMEIIDRKRIEQ